MAARTPRSQTRSGPTDSRRTPTVTLDAIVEAALEIAGDDGLEALSIRAVAGRLGISPMSTYRFIESKGDLLDEIVMRVFDRVEAPPSFGDTWVDRMVGVMGVWRELLLQHPSVVQILSTRYVPARSEGLARLEENALAALEQAGISGDDAVGAFWQIFAFTFGHVVFELPRRGLDDDSQADAGGAMRLVASRRGFPRVEKLADRLTSLAARDSFDTSLRTLLAGIEARSGGREPGS